jgi:hypothetical protein
MTEHANADRQQRYADAAGLLPALTRPETIGGAWAKDRLAAVMALADEEIRAALDPASPATRPSPAPADDEGISFEKILAAPVGQFDLRGDLLASVEAWTNAPSTTMSALPADDEGTRTGVAPSEGHSEAQGGIRADEHGRLHNHPYGGA